MHRGRKEKNYTFKVLIISQGVSKSDVCVCCKITFHCTVYLVLLSTIPDKYKPPTIHCHSCLDGKKDSFDEEKKK